MGRKKKKPFNILDHVWCDIHITIIGTPINGLTRVTYKDGIETVETGLKVEISDPVFSAVSPNFIPQQKD